ncbi:MAG: low-specificity L-threonine aldolase [Thermotogota bacterium]
MRLIDLRSDTVTQPTDGMRRAMASAVVGDDVFGEDPTVRQLEERMADLVGKEAGLFVASGTMANLVALLTHAGRGDEVIMGNLAHTFLYEVGGSAALGGIHSCVLPNQDDGTLDLDAVAAAVRSRDDIHVPRTKLLCLENTHNRCGGACLSTSYLDTAGAVARAKGLSVHIDGARLLNASRALGIAPANLTRVADSVSVCLSKGLGAPVGSVLCGSKDYIRAALRWRKTVGGGMRQAGVLAAAGLYALDHHVERLDEDHRNAGKLAEGIAAIPGLSSPQSRSAPTAWTNLVYLAIAPATFQERGVDARVLSDRLRRQGVLALPIGKDNLHMRLVTHLDVTSSDIDVALDALRSAVRGT